MRVEQTAAQAGMPESVVPALTRPLATANVLVICGNPGMRKRISGCLQDGSHNIRAAVLRRRESFEDALARDGIDLLIVELGQPVLDGLKLVRRLRSKTNLPMIALAPGKDTIDRAAVFEAGADDCMLMSFVPQELVACMRTLLHGPTKRAQPAVEPAAEIAAVLRQILGVYLRM